jgi:predicted DNA-binding protein
MKRKPVHRDHCLNVFISYEIRERLRQLAGRYDRTVADIVRALIKIGIPMMEGISIAEETMVKEYVELFRRFRKIKSIKEL